MAPGPTDTRYAEYRHWKVWQADRGIVSSTTFDEWLKSRSK
jgi:hypothetical protein